MTNELINLDNYTPEQLSALSNQLVNKRLSTLEHDVQYLKEEQPIPPGTLQRMENKRKAVVIDFLGGKRAKAYREMNRVIFAEAGRDFKEFFGIPRYDLLPKKNIEAAFEYWDNWEPSTNTKMKISAYNNQLELMEQV